MVNFPTRIPNCGSHSPALLDFFLFSDAIICSPMAFLPLEIRIMLLSQFPLTFHHIHSRMSSAIALLMTGTVYMIILEMFHGRISLNLVLLLLLVNSVWVQVGIDVYIPHRKYQVKSHSSPWFSAACVSAILHRNPFFHLYQKDKSSESKVHIRHASNRCKWVFETAKLAYANKSTSLPRNLALRTFGELPIVFATKVNLLYLFYSTTQRCCLLHLIKRNCLLETFLRTLTLMTQVSLYLFSLLELI